MLGIVNMVLEVLERLVQFLVPLAVRHIKKIEGECFYWENVAIEYMIFFNISVLLACRVCRVQMLFWLLHPC